MTLAVSNIAWTAADDEAAYAMLRDLDVSYLEIAPTRFWPDLTQVTEEDARRQADYLLDRGFTVCAFQALLFGKAGLQLFAEDGGRELIDYTKHVCSIASWMGARSLVFGSPKNRLRGELSPEVANVRAMQAFSEIADHCLAEGVVLCLEPNPPGYGGDFITRAPEAMELVSAVNSPGFAMNFDMGEIIMNQEDAAETIRACWSHIGHFHISEPMLEPFDAAREEHQAASRTLEALRYRGIVSVEMKTPAAGLSVVEAAVRSIKSVYAI